jgi:hypothetical protein
MRNKITSLPMLPIFLQVGVKINEYRLKTMLFPIAEIDSDLRLGHYCTWWQKVLVGMKTNSTAR